ncbi:MAG TPA: DUF222 domain-containing protein [Pseudonocardiaceae bacterium]|nr:DUF222 domain-containing protein [Pseudonocardiaceae bacterium]
MKLTDLIEGLRSAVLDAGGRISAAEARRLACDACIVPMVLGSDSMPLDVGREQRLATAAQRDAWPTVTTVAHFRVAIARPVIAVAATSYRGWTGTNETR